MKKRYMCFIVCLLSLPGPATLRAEISENIWTALLRQSVTLEKGDGSEIAGTLDSVADKAVAVVKPGGRVVSIAKGDVANVRINLSSSAEGTSNDVWTALLHQTIVLEKADGSEVAGQLDSVTDDSATVITTSGTTVAVPKVDVHDALLAAATALPQRETSAAKEPTPIFSARPEDFTVSAGAGILVGYMTHPDLKYDYAGSSYETTYGLMPLGAEAFVDLTYAQVSVGYMLATGRFITSKVDDSSSGGNLGEAYGYLTLAAYLKYPFRLGPIKLFPLLGLQYRLNLSYEEQSDFTSALTGQDKSDLNEIWLEAGVGADVPIGRFFIRPEVLVGFKPSTTTDSNFLKALKALGDTNVSMSFFTARVELLAGYRF